jgi:hypothetical protein
VHLEFSSNDYLSISVVSPGTAGVAYDCLLGASMKCGNFSGTVEAWVDGADVKGFIDELEQLNKTLRGNATLSSDDGGRSLNIEVVPADSLGHFLLKVKMGKDVPVHSGICETLAVGVFSFEAQAMESICQQLTEGVTGKSNA